MKRVEYDMSRLKSNKKEVWVYINTTHHEQSRLNKRLIEIHLSTFKLSEHNYNFEHGPFDGFSSAVSWLDSQIMARNYKE